MHMINMVFNGALKTGSVVWCTQSFIPPACPFLWAASRSVDEIYMVGNWSLRVAVSKATRGSYRPPMMKSAERLPFGLLCVFTIYVNLFRGDDLNYICHFVSYIINPALRALSYSIILLRFPFTSSVGHYNHACFIHNNYKAWDIANVDLTSRCVLLLRNT